MNRDRGFSEHARLGSQGERGEVGYIGDGLKTNEDVARIFLEPFFEF